MNTSHTQLETTGPPSVFFVFISASNKDGHSFASITHNVSHTRFFLRWSTRMFFERFEHVHQSDHIRQWIMMLITEAIHLLDADVTTRAQQRACQCLGLFEQLHDDALFRFFLTFFFCFKMVEKKKCFVFFSFV
jgi:hypothetical protein